MLCHTREVPRFLVLIATALSLLAASCGAESVTAGGELLPTAVPAPTVAGEIIEQATPEVQAETVLIGVSSSETVAVHARPGLDQPLAGEVPPGTSIEPLGQAFETEDGLIWWQVRAGAIQGWIQPNIAYRGPAQDITEAAVARIGEGTEFASPEESAAAIAKSILIEEGAEETIVVSTVESGDPIRATVTVDVLGLQDDSVLGYRLIVASSASTGWQPESVFQTSLCARGVSPDGLCL